MVVVVVVDEYSQMCLSTLGNTEGAVHSLLKRTLHSLHRGGVGLCNLMLSQVPWAHLRETTQLQNERSPHPAHYKENSQSVSPPTFGNWLLLRTNPKTFTNVCLFGKPYPLPYIFSNVS